MLCMLFGFTHWRLLEKNISAQQTNETSTCEWKWCAHILHETQLNPTISNSQGTWKIVWNGRSNWMAERWIRGKCRFTVWINREIFKVNGVELVGYNCSRVKLKFWVVVTLIYYLFIIFSLHTKCMVIHI